MTDEVLLSGYVRRLFAAEDRALEELRYELSRRGLPEIQVSAEVGRLLQVLLRAVGASRVLEIGTLGGYSAIWMARALPVGGRVVTIEIDPGHAAFAREFIDRAGVGAAVEIVQGDAADVLPGLAPAFDAVFIDADKERYPLYLEQALRLVRRGGLILADNAFWKSRVLEDEPESAATRGVQAFNERIATEPRLASTVLPVGDGVAVAVVVG